jgi:geranylgeranyl diphosphate synthase type II
MTCDLKTYLAERRALVENRLFDCLPTPSTRPARLAEAIGHAVRSGGKRLRPILALAAAEAAGGTPADAILPACSVELLHTYTLVHDDLPCMDNDLLRRGQPTVHAKYGEALSVLVGDALQALAFEVLARTPEKRPGTVARLVGELAAAAGPTGVVGGQVEDIRCAPPRLPATPSTMFFSTRRPTSSAPPAARRHAADAAEPHLARLSAYADGLRFRLSIIDDLLDAQAAKADDKPELSCLAVFSVAEPATGPHTHAQRNRSTQRTARRHRAPRRAGRRSPQPSRMNARGKPRPPSNHEHHHSTRSDHRCHGPARPTGSAHLHRCSNLARYRHRLSTRRAGPRAF